MIRNILNAYLSSVGLKEGSDYNFSIINSSTENVKNFVKANIQKGNPVLIGIYNNILVDGHYCIAYDYDNDTDEIYANFGWRTTNQHTRVSNGYKYYYYGLAIEFNIEHKHSDNYVVQKLGSGEADKYYCWDDCAIVTSTLDKHDYTEHCDKVNGTYHLSYCACGAYIQEEHELEWYIDPNWDGTLPLDKIKICNYCGYKKVIKKFGGGSGNNLLKKEDEYEDC